MNQLREESMRKAVAGEMRGKGKVPFTSPPTLGSANGQTDGWGLYFHDALPASNFFAIIYGVSGYSESSFDIGASVSVVANDGQILTGVVFNITSTKVECRLKPDWTFSHRVYTTSDITGWYIIPSYFLSPEFDSPPWVDIIGDPERIAVTFPDGVVGQWIPQFPGSVQTWNLNRKLNGSRFQKILWTTNDGSTWDPDDTAAGWSFSSVTNNVSIGTNSRIVSLLVYEISSNFTEPSTNSVVLGDVGKVHTSADNFGSQSNRLTPSLIGKIGKDNQGGNQLRSNSV
ncbi:hypothetical protein [Pseudoalteromonas aurantia]|nr:hypothetical protein [Pseudoalteromonas aurantia]